MSSTRTYRLVRAVKLGTDWRKKIAKPANRTISAPIEALLSEPSWSVRSLLPSPSAPTKTASTNPNSQSQEITPETLRHLLRLSALPEPSSSEEENAMLQTLRSQIHFVKEVQKVNTTGVEPLQAIRDETDAGIAEKTVTLADLQPFLDMEEKVGRNGTIRRKKDVEVQEGEPRKEMDWDPFELGRGSEKRKIGSYFFVKKVRKERSEGDERG